MNGLATEHLNDFSILRKKSWHEFILFMGENQQCEIDKKQVKYLSIHVCKNSLDTFIQFPK